MDDFDALSLIYDKRCPIMAISSDWISYWCHVNDVDSVQFWTFNSLAPGRFKVNFRWVIFKLILVTGGWGISCKIALRWMPLDLTDDKSTLVQVMAWCRQATSHYLSQCWPRSMPPYGVTRPQWVKPLKQNQNAQHLPQFGCCWLQIAS